MDYNDYLLLNNVEKDVIEKFPQYGGENYFKISTKQNLEKWIENKLFYMKLNKFINIKKNTLYCVRMWFGSGLDYFKWKLLREDVSINSEDTIPSSLPFTQYRHILVFDPSLIDETVRLEIERLSYQWNICTLPLNLSKIFPYFSEIAMDFYKEYKNRLQCLFAYYLEHVALFDFDVKMKKSIHAMLLAQSPVCKTLVGIDDNGNITTEAFVNIRMNEGGDGDGDNDRLAKVAISYDLTSLNSLVESGDIKNINNHVTQNHRGRRRQKMQRERSCTLADAQLFHHRVILNPEHYSYRNIFGDMDTTMYCVRMWFGSDLDDLHWTILRHDVAVNNNNSSSFASSSSSAAATTAAIPSWLPFTRYVHLLVFDSSLVTAQIAANICSKCKKFGIQPLDINLYRVIPFLLEKNSHVTTMYETLKIVKNRLQCLFAYYIKHVASFDFDVKFHIPIHQMLQNSRNIYKVCNENMSIPQNPVNCCLFSTKDNSDIISEIQSDAFVNIRLTKLDTMLVSNFDKINQFCHMKPNVVVLYLDNPCGINAINQYVERRQKSSGTKRFQQQQQQQQQQSPPFSSKRMRHWPKINK